MVLVVLGLPVNTLHACMPRTNVEKKFYLRVSRLYDQNSRRQKNDTVGFRSLTAYENGTDLSFRQARGYDRCLPA